MRITVLRGISGAGKSTWAARHAHEALVVSTDAFFLVRGEYRFDPRKLQENHGRCFRAFMEGILRAKPWIIVDNTNVQAWEYAPYVLAGQAYGYEVELLTFPCSVETSLARKQLVPAEDLRHIHARFEQETREMPRRFRGIHRLMADPDAAEQPLS